MTRRDNTQARQLLLLQVAGIMIVACHHDAHAQLHVDVASTASASRPRRLQLHQGRTSSGPASRLSIAGIRAADFSSVPGPADLTAELAFDVPEIQLEGTIDVLADSPGSDDHESAYHMGPSQVDQLSQAISAELVRLAMNRSTYRPRRTRDIRFKFHRLINCSSLPSH